MRTFDHNHVFFTVGMDKLHKHLLQFCDSQMIYSNFERK